LKEVIPWNRSNIRVILKYLSYLEIHNNYYVQILVFFCNLIFNKNKLYTKKQFGNNIIALLLLISLLSPSAFQFVSIFEKHEHIVCSEQQVHVHESIVECDVCLFHFTPLNYTLAQYKDLEVLLIPETIKDSFASLLFHSFTVTNIQLRGPPVLT